MKLVYRRFEIDVSKEKIDTGRQMIFCLVRRPQDETILCNELIQSTMSIKQTTQAMKRRVDKYLESEQ